MDVISSMFCKGFPLQGQISSTKYRAEVGQREVVIMTDNIRSRATGPLTSTHSTCTRSPQPNKCLSYSGFPQKLENLENESGHGKVTEKSWNMKNWPKVKEFCNQSWY